MKKLTFTIIILICSSVVHAQQNNISGDLYKETLLYINKTFGEKWLENSQQVNVIEGKIKLRFNKERWVGVKNELHVTGSANTIRFATSLNRYKNKIESVTLLIDGYKYPFISKFILGEPLRKTLNHSVSIDVKECGDFYILAFVKTNKKLYWGYRTLRINIGDCVGIKR